MREETGLSRSHVRSLECAVLVVVVLLVGPVECLEEGLLLVAVVPVGVLVGQVLDGAIAHEAPARGECDRDRREDADRQQREAHLLAVLVLEQRAGQQPDTDSTHPAGGGNERDLGNGYIQVSHGASGVLPGETSAGGCPFLRWTGIGGRSLNQCPAVRS